MFRKGLPVPGRSQPLFFIPSGNMAGNTSDGEGSLGMNGKSVSNGTRSSPINISH